MASLVFTLDGSHEDLDWVRTRVHGVIVDEIEEQVEDGRIGEGAIEVSWEWND